MKKDGRHAVNLHSALCRIAAEMDYTRARSCIRTSPEHVQKCLEQAAAMVDEAISYYEGLRDRCFGMTPNDALAEILGCNPEKCKWVWKGNPDAEREISRGDAMRIAREMQRDL